MNIKWKRVFQIALVAILALTMTGCLDTWKVYTQSFSRATTIKIDRAVEDNSNTIGGGAPVVAGMICKYAVEILPVAATCVAIVLASFWRLKDVLGQIKRSSTEKCLKVEYHITFVPGRLSFANIFPTKCANAPKSGASGFDTGGSGGGLGGGGGSSW